MDEVRVDLRSLLFGMVWNALLLSMSIGVLLLVVVRLFA